MIAVKTVYLHLMPLISNCGRKKSQKFKDFQIFALKVEKEVGAWIYLLVDQEATRPVPVYSVLKLTET